MSDADNSQLMDLPQGGSVVVDPDGYAALMNQDDQAPVYRNRPNDPTDSANDYLDWKHHALPHQRDIADYKQFLADNPTLHSHGGSPNYDGTPGQAAASALSGVANPGSWQDRAAQAMASAQLHGPGYKGIANPTTQPGWLDRYMATQPALHGRDPNEPGETTPGWLDAYMADQQRAAASRHHPWISANALVPVDTSNMAPDDPRNPNYLLNAQKAERAAGVSPEDEAANREWIEAQKPPVAPPPPPPVTDHPYIRAVKSGLNKAFMGVPRALANSYEYSGVPAQLNDPRVAAIQERQQRDDALTDRAAEEHPYVSGAAEFAPEIAGALATGGESVLARRAAKQAAEHTVERVAAKDAVRGVAEDEASNYIGSGLSKRDYLERRWQSMRDRMSEKRGEPIENPVPDSPVPRERSVQDEIKTNLERRAAPPSAHPMQFENTHMEPTGHQAAPPYSVRSVQAPAQYVHPTHYPPKGGFAGYGGAGNAVDANTGEVLRHPGTGEVFEVAGHDGGRLKLRPAASDEERSAQQRDRLLNWFHENTFAGYPERHWDGPGHGFEYSMPRRQLLGRPDRNGVVSPWERISSDERQKTDVQKDDMDEKDETSDKPLKKALLALPKVETPKSYEDKMADAIKAEPDLLNKFPATAGNAYRDAVTGGRTLDALEGDGESAWVSSARNALGSPSSSGLSDTTLNGLASSLAGDSGGMSVMPKSEQSKVAKPGTQEGFAEALKESGKYEDDSKRMSVKPPKPTEPSLMSDYRPPPKPEVQIDQKPIASGGDKNIDWSKADVDLGSHANAGNVGKYAVDTSGVHDPAVAATDLPPDGSTETGTKVDSSLAGPRVVNVPAQDLPRTAPERISDIVRHTLEQGRGIQGEADAMSATSRAEANLYRRMGETEQRNAQESIAQEQARREKVDRLMEDLRGQADAIATQKIDPTHYWTSKDNGAKAMTVMALMFGGMLQGMHGGENPAMKMVNEAIDRDIQVQKANMMHRKEKLDTTKSQLELMRMQFGDERAAESAVKLSRLNSLKAFIEGEKAKYQDPVFQARADTMLAQLNVKADQLGIDLHQYIPAHAAVVGRMGEAPASDMEKYVPQLGTIFFRKQDAEDTVNELHSYEDLQNVLGSIQRIRAKGLPVPGTPEYTQLNSLSGRAQQAIQNIANFKRLSKTDEEINNHIMSDATAIFNGKGTDENLRALRNAMAQQQVERIRARGGVGAQHGYDPVSGGLKVYYTGREMNTRGAGKRAPVNPDFQSAIQ